MAGRSVPHPILHPSTGIAVRTEDGRSFEHQVWVSMRRTRSVGAQVAAHGPTKISADLQSTHRPTQGEFVGRSRQLNPVPHAHASAVPRQDRSVAFDGIATPGVFQVTKLRAALRKHNRKRPTARGARRIPNQHQGVRREVDDHAESVRLEPQVDRRRLTGQRGSLGRAQVAAQHAVSQNFGARGQGRRHVHTFSGNDVRTVKDEEPTFAWDAAGVELASPAVLAPQHLDEPSHVSGCGDHAGAPIDAGLPSQPAPLLGVGFARKAIERPVGLATHPAAFPNAPQLAANPAQEMNAGRPGPECARFGRAAFRTLRPPRRVGIRFGHAGRVRVAINFGAGENTHVAGRSRGSVSFDGDFRLPGRRRSGTGRFTRGRAGLRARRAAAGSPPDTAPSRRGWWPPP